MSIRLTFPSLMLLSLLVFGFVSNRERSKRADKVKLTYRIKAKLGEGAFWDHRSQRLFWIDIEGKKAHLFDPASRVNSSFDTPSRIGTIVPKNEEEAVVALEDGIYMLNTKTGSLSLLSDVEAEMTWNRFNDGKCDPMGNLWVGSMHLEQTAAKASLYKVEESGLATKMLDSVTISNGIVWSRHKKTMYYIDTPTGCIRAFDFDPFNATISNERIVVKIDPSIGFGDGMAIDSEDKLWVALWNGGAIARFDPENGKLMEKIKVPAHNITSCSFGGADFETLYITTASIDMTAKERENFPLAGSLFEVKPGVKGVAGNYFAQKP